MVYVIIAFSVLTLILIRFIFSYRKVIRIKEDENQQIKQKKIDEQILAASTEYQKIKRELAVIETRRESAQERYNDAVKHEQEKIDQAIENLKQVEFQRLKHAVNIKKVELLEKIDKDMAIFEVESRQQLIDNLNKEREEKLTILKEEHELLLAKMLQERVELDEMLVPLREELENYKAKRDAINQDILRNRELEMKQDFHRIILEDVDKEDISYLHSIENKLHNKEVLRKLIWSAYLLKPTNEMINRVLEGKTTKNCIYKITNSLTQEIYIGKTVGEVSNRWKEHIKTSLEIGKISSSKLHQAFEKYGWDNFTFEVLEKDIKDLGDREKYYINFFESNIYGLNRTKGG